MLTVVLPFCEPDAGISCLRNATSLDSTTILCSVSYSRLLPVISRTISPGDKAGVTQASKLDVLTVAIASVAPNLQRTVCEETYPVPYDIITVPPTQGKELGKTENTVEGAAQICVRNLKFRAIHAAVP